MSIFKAFFHFSTTFSTTTTATKKIYYILSICAVEPEGENDMKFTWEKHLLQNAIAITSRASSPKSPIPAVEGLLFEAGIELRVTGYDM